MEVHVELATKTKLFTRVVNPASAKGHDEGLGANQLVDAVVLGLVNRGQVDRTQHTEQRDGGCFLNEAGRKLYLQAFIDRMEGAIDQDEGGSIPRW